MQTTVKVIQYTNQEKTLFVSLFGSVWKRSSVMKTWFDFLFPSYGYTLIQRRYKYVSSKQHFQLLYSTVHSSGKSVWPKLNIHISNVVYIMIYSWIGRTPSWKQIWSLIFLLEQMLLYVKHLKRIFHWSKSFINLIVKLHESETKKFDMVLRLK